MTNLNDGSRRILVGETNNQIKYNFSYAIPNPAYLSHVIVESLNINDVKAVHGGGISFYGLTANVTTSYCS